MRDDDWPPLTDEDRRGIARIRRQLDEEFGINPPGLLERWRSVVLGVAVATMSLAAGGITRETMPASPTVEPPRPLVSIQPSDAPTPEPFARSIPPERTAGLTVRDALDAWIDATQRGDVSAQMTFYPAVVPVFYTWRDAPSDAVLAEKRKVLGEAWTLDIRTGPPTIAAAADGDTAVTRFRKSYVIEGPRVRRRGAVIQELRWVRTDGGWKITSERETVVLARSARRSAGATGAQGTTSWRTPVTRDVSVAGQSNAP